IPRVLELFHRRVCLPRHPRQHFVHSRHHEPKEPVIHRLLPGHGASFRDTSHPPQAERPGQRVHRAGARHVACRPVERYRGRTGQGVAPGPLPAVRSPVDPQLGHHVAVDSVPAHLRQAHRLRADVSLQLADQEHYRQPKVGRLPAPVFVHQHQERGALVPDHPQQVFPDVRRRRAAAHVAEHVEQVHQGGQVPDAQHQDA
ncbi:hypothetical protein BN1723_019389, partial [Verticillium longisporum]